MIEAALASWSHPGYQRVAELLGEHTGLAFSAARVPDAEAGIRRALTRAGAPDVTSYAAELESGCGTLDDLIAELTVGETYFFREPLQWEVIREEILPSLTQQRPPGHTLRVWSAGCASGEEAYSLAIALDEGGLAERAQILGTDLSRAALEKAEAASYGPWSLRGTDPLLVARHFTPEGPRWRLEDRIRRQVRFESLNLARDRYPSFASGTWRMDLILCRNVLIYLDDAAVQRVARQLAECLAPGGWLITGPSDPSVNDDGALEAVVSKAGILYRRPTASISPAPSPRSGEGWGEAAAPLPIVDRGEYHGPSPTLPAERGGRPEGGRAEVVDPLAAAREAFARGDYALVSRLTADLPDAAAAALSVRAAANHHGAEAAERRATAALARHPSSPELHLLRAVLLLDRGKLAEAAQAARRALYLDRTLAMGHFLLGTALARLDDRAGARKAFRNALAQCAPLPPDQPVPFADGQRAAHLAEAVEAQLHLLATRRAS